MVMIGEETNLRDRPIYLQVRNINDVSSFWYVIEEKDDDGIEEEEDVHHKNKKINQIHDDEIQKHDKKKKRKHGNEDEEEEIHHEKKKRNHRRRHGKEDEEEEIHHKKHRRNRRNKDEEEEIHYKKKRRHRRKHRDEDEEEEIRHKKKKRRHRRKHRDEDEEEEIRHKHKKRRHRRKHRDEDEEEEIRHKHKKRRHRRKHRDEEEEEEIHHKHKKRRHRRKYRDEDEEEEIHHKKKKRKQIQDDEIQKDDKKKKTNHRNNIPVMKQRETDDRNNKNNNISVLKQSETDEIRELQLPHPSLNSSSRAKLVVFNSRLCLFGGDGGCPSNNRDVVYLDINDPEKRWLNGPILKPGLTLSVAALQKSGLFIAFGKKEHNVEPFLEFLDESFDGDWQPGPPIREPERSQIDDARLLAVTDTKVYMHGVGDNYRMGLSFDLQNSEWNIFDLNFHGSWSPGVVLDFSGNSYLFSFGIHGLEYRRKSTPSIDNQQIWVYDLNKCAWLPLPVQGLPDDDTFLPDPKKNRLTGTYLLKMNQRNKLALVWSKPLYDLPEFANKIHCTKFIIDCTTDSDSQRPIFCAKVVSFGSYHVKNRSQGSVVNCASSLEKMVFLKNNLK